jgi:hypothetical protein
MAPLPSLSSRSVAVVKRSSPKEAAQSTGEVSRHRPLDRQGNLRTGRCARAERDVQDDLPATRSARTPRVGSPCAQARRRGQRLPSGEAPERFAGHDAEATCRRFGLRQRAELQAVSSFAKFSFLALSERRS